MFWRRLLFFSATAGQFVVQSLCNHIGATLIFSVGADRPPLNHGARFTPSTFLAFFSATQKKKKGRRWGSSQRDFLPLLQSDSISHYEGNCAPENRYISIFFFQPFVPLTEISIDRKMSRTCKSLAVAKGLGFFSRWPISTASNAPPNWIEISNI